MIFAVKVELFVDAAWVDITALGHVYTRDSVTITRGRSSESSRVEPSRCSLTLNNRDGRYSPRNPTSPLYGKIGRNTQIRVSVGPDVRFVGEVTAWPQHWDKSGSDVWVPIEAAGIMRRLGQGNKPLRSALYRQVSTRSFVTAYWPMEDNAGATSAASTLEGVSPLQIIGPVTFAQEAGPGGSDPLPNFDDAGEFRGRIPRMGDDWCADWLFRTGEAPAGEIVLLLVSTTSADAEHFQVLADGTDLIVRCFDSDSVSVLDQSVTLPAGFYGQWLRCRLVSFQNGADVGVLLSVFQPGNTDALAEIVTGISTSDSGSPIRVAITSATQARQLGHLTFTEGADDDPFAFGADNGYATERADERLIRLCDEAGITLSIVGIGADTAAMGAQRSGILLDLLQECADADLGILYEPRDGLGLRYHTRTLLYNQLPLLELDYTDGVFGALPEPVDDDQQTRNDITVKRTGGSEARAVLEVGPLSVLDPPDGVGTYDTQVTANLVGDGFLPNHAGWLLNLGTVDEARYPRLVLPLHAPAFTSNAPLTAAVVAIDQGDMIRVMNLPAWLPPDDVSLIAAGFTETIDTHLWTIEVNCVPGSPYTVAEYESAAGAGVNKYDTAGSQLNEALTTTETDVDVLTTIGPVWTADNAEDGFDILVGGEVMTVTDIGAASAGVQTFTCTRSVNGVVKTHAAGAAVRLHPPPRYAL